MEKFIVALLTALVIGALESWIFMLLFNYFANTFNAPHFGFWESWGLMILINLVGRRFNNITYTSS